MKDLILGVGRIILDVLVIVCFLVAFVSFIISWYWGSFIAALGVFIVSCIAIFLAFFTIYLLIDIRDGLVKK